MARKKRKNLIKNKINKKFKNKKTKTKNINLKAKPFKKDKKRKN